MLGKNDRRRLTATERVEEHIRHAIYRGDLMPRERIIEENLATHLKCSRGPVREAILRLERDGLVVNLSRRGTFIRDMSMESIEVIFSMRGKLEALCVRYLRERLTEQMERTLCNVLKKMESAAAKEDDHAFLAADMKFHQTIWQLSNRETLEHTLSTIMNPFIFMLARAYSNQMPIAMRYKGHAEYLEIVLTERISKVERSVEQHFGKLAREVLSRLPSPFLAVGRGISMSSNSSSNTTVL